MQPPPASVMLHIAFDQDWPTGSEIFKSESVEGGQRRQTEDGPLVYYKLTMSAFGSGELKKIRIGYFSTRNPYMKFQNPSMQGSQNMACIRFHLDFIQRGITPGR